MKHVLIILIFFNLLIACSEQSRQGWDIADMPDQNPITMRANINTSIQELNNLTIPKTPDLETLIYADKDFKNKTQDYPKQYQHHYKRSELKAAYDSNKIELETLELKASTQTEEQVQIFLETQSLTSFNDEQYQAIKLNLTRLSQLSLLDEMSKKTILSLKDKLELLKLSVDLQEKLNLIETTDLNSINALTTLLDAPPSYTQLKSQSEQLLKKAIKSKFKSALNHLLKEAETKIKALQKTLTEKSE